MTLASLHHHRQAHHRPSRPPGDLSIMTTLQEMGNSALSAKQYRNAIEVSCIASVYVHTHHTNQLLTIRGHFAPPSSTAEHSRKAQPQTTLQPNSNALFLPVEQKPTSDLGRSTTPWLTAIVRSRQTSPALRTFSSPNCICNVQRSGGCWACTRTRPWTTRYSTSCAQGAARR